MKAVNGLQVLMLGLLVSTVAAAMEPSAIQGGSLGAGVTLGQPLGATVKYWASTTSAVDAELGYHIDDNADIHADYLYHIYPFNIPQTRLPLYGGLGGRILAGDDTQFGLRIPLGVSYLPTRSPIEVFAEVAPVIRLNGIKASVDGVVGIRMYAPAFCASPK